MVEDRARENNCYNAEDIAGEIGGDLQVRFSCEEVDQCGVNQRQSNVNRFALLEHDRY